MMEIDHVVVLMLENRSFDSMLGLLGGGPSFDGLTGTESNSWSGGTVTVWSSLHLTPQAIHIPDPDPRESFADITEQIFGPGQAPPAPATMGGFVANYMKTPTNDPRAVMHGFAPEQVPVLSALAENFGVSDRWYASAPCQTWPNRFFAHAGTAAGYTDNTWRLYEMETIFNRLTEKRRSWRIYHHDAPQSFMLARIWSELPEHLYPFEPQFAADAQAGRLPNYSFIEPRYYPDRLTGRLPNDQHPPHDITLGERLIAQVYDAVRSGPGWPRTLLIITHDEHGGIYDHSPPPAALPPDNSRQQGFAFDRFGVRVPAVIVSPWIPQGSLIRPPEGAAYPFDHTTILATLRRLFDLEPLTARDAAAPDLLHALSLPEPSNQGPASIPMLSASISRQEMEKALAAPPNALQIGLAEMADHLPSGAAGIP
ncbi:MAG TPA: alkaline phosphatase family protein, partial [Acetobacteraceae bacterium]|nr:alkaline phosphatase family protein [Acetobacteraceae bacterium]